MEYKVEQLRFGCIQTETFIRHAGCIEEGARLEMRMGELALSIWF